MTDVNKSHVKLVITPASLLEQVVARKLPMQTLMDCGSLENIINPSDLLFYCWVQTKHKQLVPNYVHRVFDPGFNDDGYEETETNKLSEIRFKQMTDRQTDLMKMLALTSRPPTHVKLTDSNVNTYVGHYYAIDKQTIGMVFMASKTPSVDELTALRGLIVLLTSNYLGSVDGVANLSNDVHTINLVKTGLLDAYGKLII